MRTKTPIQINVFPFHTFWVALNGLAASFFHLAASMMNGGGLQIKVAQGIWAFPFMNGLIQVRKNNFMKRKTTC